MKHVLSISATSRSLWWGGLGLYLYCAQTTFYYMHWKNIYVNISLPEKISIWRSTVHDVRRVYGHVTTMTDCFGYEESYRNDDDFKCSSLVLCWLGFKLVSRAPGGMPSRVGAPDLGWPPTSGKESPWLGWRLAQWLPSNCHGNGNLAAKTSPGPLQLLSAILSW